LKVYLVTYAIDRVEGVFSSREFAESFIRNGQGDGGVPDEGTLTPYEVYEYEIDNPAYEEVF
jgi:hypothetical protein